MTIAEQLQTELNFNKIINQLSRELANNSPVFIESHLVENNIQKLRSEGFNVETEGAWRNGGVYVSFKTKSQYE